MIPRPPSSTLTVTLVPYPTLFRSGEHLAEPLLGDEALDVLCGDFGVDGHEESLGARWRRCGGCGAARAGQAVATLAVSSLGSLKATFSTTPLTFSTFTSKRSRHAATTSSTRTSGAEAPAVMPRLEMPASFDQSMSAARCTRSARAQPSRQAPPTNR